jgi:hypothetical protein
MLEVQLIGSQEDVDTTEANIIGLYKDNKLHQERIEIA